MLAVLLLGLGLLVPTGGAFAESRDTAPFGLTWGMSDRDFYSLGLRTVAVETPTQRMTRIYFAPAGGMPDDTIAVSVGIDVEYGLQAVWWRGHPIEDDPYGDDGRAAYRTMKNALATRYGDPRDESTFSGRFVFTDPAEFFQCLSYSGCGAWMAFWYPPNGGSVYLHLVGTGRGRGHVDVAYKGPKWKAAAKAQQEAE
ncbi:MAG: hypothetical protein CMM50_10460 [Rhodospirillaceae bacterium]|nr:hypothetical protein [Rhodospirillaceae bacterium]